MSQEKKKREDESVPVDESPPVEGTPAVEENTPKNTKTKPAPAKSSVTLVLVGAGSYANMVLNVGPFRKGKPFEADEAIAEALLGTGLFERV